MRPNTLILLGCIIVLLAGAVIISVSDCPPGKTLTVPFEARRLNWHTSRIRRQSSIVERDGALELWMTPEGQFWAPAQTSKSLPFVLAEQYIKIYGAGRFAVRPGDVVLDCGADVGDFTRQALQMGASMVVAIEPSPMKQVCLQRNLEREVSQGKVIVYPKGVWNTESTLTLYVDTVVEKRGGDGVVVPLTTIDNLVSELNLPSVDFIKMDIEGAEVPALLGAAATLARYRPRMSISTEHYPDDVPKVTQAVRTAVPSYGSACGMCALFAGRIRPYVIHFY